MADLISTKPAVDPGFPVVTRGVEIGDRVWQVTAVENQDRLLDDVRTDHDQDNFAYGLLLWAAAVGLSEHLVESPGLVQHQRVLELGCGVGLAGLVAASLGAHVTQSDYLETALDLARVNAMQNDIDGVERFRADWREFPNGPVYDVVIGSDVLYERSMHPAISALLPRLVSPEGIVILTDPIRPQALDFVQQMENDGWRVEMNSRLVSWEGSRCEIAVFTAAKSQTRGQPSGGFRT